MKLASSNYPKEGLEAAFPQFADFDVIAETQMSSVFKVYSRADGLILALKLVADLGQDELAVRKFKDEYRILSRIYHERLVTVLQYGRSQIRMRNGDLRWHNWYTMHYYPDGSVAARLSALNLAMRISIIEQMLEGLSILHIKNISHRDIKPQNIFIASMNPLDVKIGDFGIAKAAAGEGEQHSRMIGGTPQYMAPERLDWDYIAQDDPDWRPSDQYAAAVTAYYILSMGGLPIESSRWGLGWDELLTLHQRRPLKQLKIPELPGQGFARTDQVLARMMAIQMADRYPRITDCKKSLNSAFTMDGLKP